MVRFAVLAVILAASAHAAILASASFVIPAVQTDYFCCHIQQDYAGDYTLLVTGGTGDGYAALDADLRWTTNETPYNAPWSFEGDANISTGLSYYCHPYCAGGHSGPPYIVPFTFGVPETLHITATASVTFHAPVDTVLPPGLAGGTIVASVDLSGIGAIYDANTRFVRDAFVSFDPAADVPEPSSWAMLLVIGASGASLGVLERRGVSKPSYTMAKGFLKRGRGLV